MSMIAWGRLIISLLIPQLVGGIAGIATARSVRDWYPHLKKPFFNPPNWVFGPAWTLLYILMGVALYRVWGMGVDDPQVRWALLLFAIQMGLNGLWSILFFGLRSPGLGLIEVVFLWLAVLGTTIAFGSLDPVSWYLLVPYLAWVSFAAVLNAAVWWLNRGDLPAV